MPGSIKCQAGGRSRIFDWNRNKINFGELLDRASQDCEVNHVFISSRRFNGCRRPDYRVPGRELVFVALGLI